MNRFETEFDKIKNLNNPQILNDFLIRISKDPKQEYLSFLNYLLNDTKKGVYEKIKLNIVFVLGEIGNLVKLSEDYTQKLIDMFYTSDRWVRYEIIRAINKISKQTKLNERVIVLLGNALNDDYLPIKKGVLEILKYLEILPDSILANFFRVLNSKESEILELSREILERLSLSSESIFKRLNNSENYKILKPRAIRSLLLVNFRSILNLETFRDLIVNAEWEISFKEQYLKEIDTMQSILLKTL